MAVDPTEVLQSSSDPDELVLAGLTLARAARPEGHAALSKHLQSQDFLSKLDTPEDYGDPGAKLRVGRIVEALSENQAPSAHEVLVTLTQVPVFHDDLARIDMLIRACAEVRPAPPEVVKFWDTYCQPLDGHTPVTIEALFDNSSEPALALFEKKMHDPKHGTGHKVGWLRDELIEHRNDQPVLECCERLLGGPLPGDPDEQQELRGVLVEVLFDFRPHEWYVGDHVPFPPPREEASEAALQQLRRIGQYALKNVELTDSQKKVVEDVLEQLSAQKP